LLAALLEPPATILILSPTERQSGRLFRKALLPLWKALGCPEKAKEPQRLSLELANGSEIHALPGKGETVRGFAAVRLLLIDEAAYVPDDLYHAVTPMLAVSKGGLVALGTPNGRQGWFHEAWVNDADWDKVKITSDQCPRITKRFLDKKRNSMGDRMFEQEFCCVFHEAEGALFRSEDIERAFNCKRTGGLFFD
jgi:hypothetical protein